MKSNNLTKYVLITGATSGIGYELAKLFAKDKYNLIIVARSEEELAATKKEFESTYGIQVIPIQKDLFEKDAAFELYQTVKEQNLFVDILVNNAGQGQYGLFVESDIHRLLEIIQLNISVLTVLTHLFLKDMLEKDTGKILQVGSTASQTPGPWQAVYHATKAFVLSFSEGVIQEIKGTGVTITVLQAGATDTDFFRKAAMENSKILDTKLSDPAQVAQDGYKALMKGEDKIISGLKNKVMIAASNIMPEKVVAALSEKMQEPKNKE